MAYTLNQLYNQRNQTQRQINQLDQKKGDISKKIERLQVAKRQLETVKREGTGPLKSDVKTKKVIGSMKWKGQYKDKFTSFMDSDTKNSAKDFHNNVDEMLDRVNLAIARYKDEYDEACGRQSRLRSTLRWIGTQIQNLLN